MIFDDKTGKIKAMTKTEVLLYGALLESDIYADGYGSTEEDTELLQNALKKIYGVTEETSEDAIKAENQIHEDMKNLVVELRSKAREYLGGKYYRERTISC